MSGLNVLVVGASIAGPMTAYWLAKAGANVTVIERFPELRTNGQAIDKPGYVEYQFGTPGTVFGTIPHELHRQRKTALLPFFSKRKVVEQVPQIQEHVARIIERLSREYADTGKILNLCNMFSCYTADVITKYSFDRTFDYLDSPDFVNPFTASFDGFKGFAHFSIQFPWLPKFLAKLPHPVVRFLQPAMTPVLDYQRVSGAPLSSPKFHVML